ncbi:MAG TPA: hypothetical protein DCE47_08535 [Planctomycetaceae bacterium]|nr:hypothetical protein [Planctomycetaceae bacterium]HCC99719.1 hypothetical protein [Planctomycetaceae bacterium]
MALGKRSRNIYDPSSTKPFKVSRSKIDLFRRCPRCFYLDRRLGVGRVPGPPFLINSATDTLLKKEFDSYREIQAPHPLMVEHRINAIPFQHPELDAWRANFTGVQVHHAETNLTITGAIDDVWITPAGRLLVVDYKSTSTTKPITLEGKWKESYKRQMEVYQWLLRQNGFDVSDIGYFVYVNADTLLDAFNGQLIFQTHLLKHSGDDRWVEPTIVAAHACMSADEAPDANEQCEWCAYRRAAVDEGV